MAGYIGSKAVNLSTTGADINGDANIDGDLSFRDNDKAIFGAGSDLQIYHDGSHSYVSDQGTGNLRIQGSDITLQDASGNGFISMIDSGTGGTVYLKHNGANVLATTSTGVDITGNLTADYLAVGTTSDSYSQILINSSTTGESELRMGDTDTDAGSVSYTNSNDTMTFRAAAGARMALNSTGLDVTGILTSDGLTVDGGANLLTRTSSGAEIDVLEVRNNATAASTASAIKFVNSTASGSNSGSTELIGIRTGTNTGDFKIRTSNSSAAMTDRMLIDSNGDISFYEDTGSSPKFFWDASAESLGVGHSSAPTSMLAIGGNATTTAKPTVTVVDTTNGASMTLRGQSPKLSFDITSGGVGKILMDGAGIEFKDGTLDSEGNVDLKIDSSGNVGIAATPPTTSGYTNLTLGASTTGSQIRLYGATSGFFHRIINNNGDLGIQADADNVKASTNLTFSVDGSEAMRIDSSGNLLLGKTTNTFADAGVALLSGGELQVTRSGVPMYLRRNGSDGDIVSFRKDGTTVGSIGCNSGNHLTIGKDDTGIAFQANEVITPYNPASNVSRDNAIDLGQSSARFDDIYATNGTIQTSDRNEKQDIAELSDAEQRVAVAAKGLMRKFRWRDAVEAKGDDARTHFGIIAQDLQAAFAAEGLDAGDYAMFISSTWTDEETGEERTRMGVRYSELLAFIIGAL